MRLVRVVIVFAFLGITQIRAQNKQILYDFVEIPQSLMVNPGANAEYRFFAGIPGLSGVSLQFGSSGITANDLFADDGLDFTTKFRERALNGQNFRDELSGVFQLEIVNAGFKLKNRPNDFYTFGYYLEGNAIGYWFEDLAELAFEGNANNLGRQFDLGHLSSRAEFLGVYHIGVNRKLRDDLTVGVRGKLYSSVFEFSSTNNEGFFITEEGTNNRFSNTLDADLELRTSGVEALTADNVDLSSVLLRRAIFSGNFGLGLDLGFTYQLRPNLVLTGSAIDLGFVYHTNDVLNYTLEGSATNEGINVFLPPVAGEFSADPFQNLIDELETLIPFSTNKNGFISFRPLKLNGSIRYDFGTGSTGGNQDCRCDRGTSRRRDRSYFRNSVGGQLYSIFRPRGPQLAVTGFYQKRFGRGFSTKLTYTADKFSFTNIGLGMNFQAGPVNFYGLMDNLLAYRNIPDANTLSFQFGINILSWNNN